MMNIQLLSQDTINQIAAGEVLERPANLVKELIENSLDADSTEIEVEIDSGGKWLRVTDNGFGINPDELKLALSRHATSKIKKFADLWALHTFGFRGEALASAASVSKLTLTSRRAIDEQASQIESQFGVLNEKKELGGNFGTQIRIESLFENVPARLKFLKTDAAETTQILKVLKAFALSNPQISIKVKVKGELKHFYLPSTSTTNRVKQVLNLNEIYEVEGSTATTNIKIIFSSPNEVANSLHNIWIFVQGRWVQDKGITKAILDSYQNLLMHGEYPHCVIMLDTDPATLDINIHPTKSHVKFQNSGDIFRLVYGTLRKKLESAPWLKSIFEKNEERSYQTPSDIFQPIAFNDNALEATLFKQKNIFASSEVPPTLNNSPVSAQEIASLQSHEAVHELVNAQHYWGQLQVIGQLNLTYILAQSGQALILVDQHAAHERVMFERLLSSYKKKNVETQLLLVPLVINLESSAIQMLLSMKDSFSEMGVYFEQGGPDVIFVSAIPAMIKESAVTQVLDKVSRDTLEYGGSLAFDKILGSVFASLACHSAVRAGQALSVKEMQELLVQMDEYPLSSFCPHGRPVYKEILFRNLDRDFGRIV